MCVCVSIYIYTCLLLVDYQTVIAWADKYKHMQVFAKISSYYECEMAAEYGAEGIGHCSTNYMMSTGDCKKWTRAAILSRT